jgi:hypothetical protein
MFEKATAKKPALSREEIFRRAAALVPALQGAAKNLRN